MNRTAGATLVVTLVTTITGPAIAHPEGLSLSWHGVVTGSSLPHCAEEDGSGASQLPCTWNVGSEKDGNGVGLAYWIGKGGRTHYVWDTNPTTSARRWVTRGQSHGLASHEGHSARYWLTCTVRSGNGRDVFRCADGRRMVIRWQ